jgi:signal transduction histidine kinase
MRPRIFHKEPDPFGPQDKPFDEASLKSSLAGNRQFTDVAMEGHRVRVLSLPLRRDGKVTGAAQFAAELDDVDLVVVRLRNTLLALLPLALVATGLLGVWLTTRALSPVKRIAMAAERIGESNLEERLPVEGNDEFAYLSGRFNNMIDRIAGAFSRLSAAYEAQRRFVADASHELKTPLTVIKGRVGLSSVGEQTPKRYAEHMAAINRAADNMSGIIQGLLFLAQADEHKLELRRSEQPVAPIVAEAAAVAGDRVVEIEVPEGLRVDADASMLLRALTNLVSNAARYTAPEKRIGIRAFPEGGQVEIEVWDEGDGIPSEDLPLIFNRFHRVDSSRDKMSGGTGLGLAIVKSIVEAHGGTVTIESEVGVGTKATIRLN